MNENIQEAKYFGTFRIAYMGKGYGCVLVSEYSGILWVIAALLVCSFAQQAFPHFLSLRYHIHVTQVPSLPWNHRE